MARQQKACAASRQGPALARIAGEGSWSLRERDRMMANQDLSLMETSANEFGAASRRVLRWIPGRWAKPLHPPFPEAWNGAKRSGRISGTQRRNLPRSGALLFAVEPVNPN